MMDRDPNTTQGGLTGELRLRVPLPIIVPFGALLLIAAMTIGFSRILLSVPKEIAVVIAVVTMANVLGACAVLASRRNVNRSVISELAIVVLYPVILGAVLATMNLDEEAHGGEAPPPPPGAASEFTETVTAEGTAFDTDEITLPAGETYELTFVNEDQVQHNIAIYASPAADKEIFAGDLITADEAVYEIEAPAEPGEAYFQCDVHPNMNGTAIIK